MTGYGARVLIVDDQEEMRELLAEMLASEGYQPMAVPGGEEALAELGRNPYDLLLTDLNMPHMDGLALLRAAHARWPGLPVVIITGYGSRNTERHVMREGARGYISKPCTLQRVITSVSAALAGPAC